MSRYYCVRFSSDHTWRIASLLKMPWNIAESMMVDAMSVSVDVVNGGQWPLRIRMLRRVGSASAENTSGEHCGLREFASLRWCRHGCFRSA